MSSPGLKSSSANMSQTDAAAHRHPAQDATSGQWVTFEEAESDPNSSEMSPGKKSTATSGSSGIGSARGSVNSVVNDHQPVTAVASEPPASISDIQVTDARSLRTKSVLDASSLNSAGRKPVVQDPGTSPAVMDHVNLSDDENQSAAARAARKFYNGEVIVTLLPVNHKLPWVTPASFRPELVPEELMAPSLTLTVEEYVQSMEKLTTDIRFTIFNICYKRILVIWIVTAFIILLALLFSGFQGIELFACGVAWLIINAAAIFICMWIKLKLSKQMERCMSVVNTGLLKHKLMIGVDDRGKISCHKINVCFIYFDAIPCIKKLEQILEEKPDESAQNGQVFDRDTYLRDVEQFDDVEVVVSGSQSSVRIDRRHKRAEKLLLHYLQRWAKDYLRRRLDWVVDDLYGRTDYSSNTNPRHMASTLCPCQYIEEHLKNKRHSESLNPCVWSKNPCHWCF